MLVFVASFFVFLMFAVVGGYFALLMAGEKMIDMQKLEDLKLEASVLYDKNGNEFGKLYIEEDREYVSFNQIPEHVRNAFVAVEDKRFFEHNGIDIIRIGGAIIKDIQAGSAVEGGSTITQQLARNVFLSHEKTFWRKTKEAMIAINLERKFSKDEILEMYLNKIYLGPGIFGVKAASKYYFGKDNLQELELHEAAMLAALPKAPGTYSPFANPDKAKERRDTVLRLMMEQNYITQPEKEAAQNQPLPENDGQEERGLKKGYRAFIDYVVREAAQVYGITEDQLYRGGWEIHTTLDPKMQDAMVSAFADPNNFPPDGADRQVQSGMVVLDPKTGGIAAMMGGRQYAAKGFNFAVDTQRQPGSSFKPLAVYAPALDSGEWNMYSKLNNTRQDFNGYKPRNYNGKYSSSVTMRQAVIDSINVPAVWLLNEMGISDAIKYIEKFGIQLQPEDRNLSIALGGLHKGTSPLAMAQAYTTFANGGSMAHPYVITKIESQEFGIVESAEPKHTQVLSAQAAWEMHLMLQAAVEEGTGRYARISGRHVAGKTGTTESEAYRNNTKYNKDAWFVGYTPNYVGAVWMGFDPEDKQNAMTQGSSKPAQLFSKVFAQGLQGVKSTDFTPPPGVEKPDKPVQMQPPQVMAVLALDNHMPEVVITWIGNEGLELTYDLYRFVDSPEEKELVQEGITANQYVDAFEGTLYKYIVIPRDAEGKEGPPSNPAEVDMSQVQRFLEDAEQHHEDQGEGGFDQNNGNEDNNGDNSGQDENGDGGNGWPGDDGSGNDNDGQTGDTGDNNGEPNDGGQGNHDGSTPDDGNNDSQNREGRNDGDDGEQRNDQLDPTESGDRPTDIPQFNNDPWGSQ
ncbi:PBP1A family penicillin-binding protein [Brevibacillus humidisoli]|uniref:PBP1A family penicillin-binding protein n=1 Tax=Brevibacillus humidisoli TaxID=2895522 RepID=UPI001E3B31C0|nr:PBP1A family penicillin-binding protein [Brevibacillus humidisoli]UFJ39368.1 PBP1A family penicillin-binding protein [Brevibacillus humidisoli]